MSNTAAPVASLPTLPAPVAQSARANCFDACAAVLSFSARRAIKTFKVGGGFPTKYDETQSGSQILRLGLADETGLTEAGVAWVEADALRESISNAVPYRCRDHELYGERRAAVLAKLQAKFSQATLRDWVAHEQVINDRSRRHAYAYNAGADLFNTMRGVYTHASRISVVEEALETAPLHARFCADFLGL